MLNPKIMHICREKFELNLYFDLLICADKIKWDEIQIFIQIKLDFLFDMSLLVLIFRNWVSCCGYPEYHQSMSKIYNLSIILYNYNPTKDRQTLNDNLKR